jgi:PAS domain S-box-containing protein
LRPRHIAPVAVLLALAVAGFVVARVLAERGVRRDSENRAEVAAAQIRGRVAQAVSLTESLNRFMADASGTGVTSDEFAKNALRWLSPARFSAAAWVERVPDSRRAAYERRIGQPIVTPDDRRTVVPPGSRSVYIPATLVSGFPPTAVPGIDLGGVPGMSTVLTRTARLDGVAATPTAPPRTGTRGVFFVQAAPNLVGDVLRRGYVVLFVSDQNLRAAAADSATVQVAAGGTPTAASASGGYVSQSFTAAGQRFEVALPKESVHAAAAASPWIILAAGFLLAALAAALGVNAARRARAQDELDRIFTLSQDLIAVANFDGRFTRVNPAAEDILGYTEEELLARPYVDLVHPADRVSTTDEADAIAQGKPTLSFENRYVRKDGSLRVLDWTTTPDVENKLMYAVARDVTERRQAEAEVERLADEQAALRRVATLVARDASQAELFTAIAEECAQLFGTEDIGMVRYEADRDQIVLASAGMFKEAFATGSRLPLGGENAASRVFQTGQPARIDDYGSATGPIAEAARPAGLHCAVATPIMVEGRLWGAMITGTSGEEPLPPDTEFRLGQFTELMATAIANTESHARADRLTEEQAGLRRVATLVAKEAPPADVFAKVAEELASVLGDVDCSLFRDEGDGTATAVALSGAGVSAGVQVGTRLPIDGDGVIASVLREGRPCRIGDYSAAAAGAIAERGRELGIRSAVGCPIAVGGRMWGAMAAAKYEPEAFPPETEMRIGQFADLVATAIANAEARAEVERLAEEQAALRRVAMLVAGGAAPEAVFDAVAAEMDGLLGGDGVTLSRYEPDEEVTVVASRGVSAARVPAGTRVSHQGENVTSMVRRAQRPVRMENYDGTDGPIAGLVRSLGVRASVAAPIVVDGRLWGVTIATWTGEESPPADTEERMAQFAELLDTAIANADSRAQLSGSRARLVTAADDARRRVVRDLHDGAQQRLVHTIVTLKLAQRAFREQDGKAEALIGEALGHAERGNAELRELAHGVLPAALTLGGLRSGVDTLVARLPLPIDVDLPVERFPPETEASAYFVVAEALTNVVKHSRAERAKVTAYVEDVSLHVEIRDDGIGGADPGGHGLVGMRDRVTALRGRLTIDSPADGGTLVTATLPLSAGQAAAG